MEPAEFRDTLNLMQDDAVAIIHNQQVLAGIHVELDKSALFPHEQDFIYEDHYGQMPAEARTQTINGVDITTRILHQTGAGLRDIVGADMLYEIENEKFSLIQYKRPHNDRVKNGSHQLDTLINNCPDVCTAKKRRPIQSYMLPLKINGFCGCWYAVVDQKEKRYIHACEAEAIFGNHGSAKIDKFSRGLSQDSFTELFASCRIGAFIRRQPHDNDVLPKHYIEPLLEMNHFILAVRQVGRWGN